MLSHIAAQFSGNFADIEPSSPPPVSRGRLLPLAPAPLCYLAVGDWGDCPDEGPVWGSSAP